MLILGKGQVVEMLEKIVRLGRLFDFYSALLTEKQQRCIDLHYLQDFSLSEIAEELGVSRQAVHDMLRRAEAVLEEYEGKLKLLERQEREREALRQVGRLLSSVPPEVRELPAIREARQRLNTLLEVAHDI